MCFSPLLRYFVTCPTSAYDVKRMGSSLHAPQHPPLHVSAEIGVRSNQSSLVDLSYKHTEKQSWLMLKASYRTVLTAKSQRGT